MSCEAAWGGFLNARDRRAIETDVMITLAGGLAEEIFSAGTKGEATTGMGAVCVADIGATLRAKLPAGTQWLIVDGDLRVVNELLHAVGEDDGTYEAWLESRTRDLLNRPGLREDIEAVATALCERKTLSGREVRLILANQGQREIEAWLQRWGRVPNPSDQPSRDGGAG